MQTNTIPVLCVDDDTATLKLRKVLLESAGYSVVTAASGAEALGIAGERNDLRLVLLDYFMPGMNGDELAEELRRQRPNLPLIAVSAVGQLPKSLLDAVDSSVQKGHDPDVLLSVMQAVLERRAARARDGESTSAQTVLCVEDEQLQLELRKTLLGSAGYRVLQARSAGAALEIFRAEPVDAVVMDYWLSGKNGTAVAEEMKRLRPRTPIVMLSGFSSLPGEGAMVDAWLRKAEIGPEELISEVRRLIGARGDGQQTAHLE